MAHITAEHLHHMAKRHHATMKKLETMQTTFRGMARRFASTAEVGAGAFLAGVVDGKFQSPGLGAFPITLGIGGAALVASHLKLAGNWSEDLNHFGNGFVANWAANTGYAFGKSFREKGAAAAIKGDW